MSRYKLTLEYDGRSFVGWQRQNNGLSVQEVVESAAFAFCQRSVVVQGAGRTDAGVHALGQVAHLDLPGTYAPERIRDALNAHMRPHLVAVLMVETVDDHFHARFSATERMYIYRIINRRTPLVLESGRAWWVPDPLNVQAMATAAQYLLGRHDFSTFRASGCQAESPVRTLNTLTVTQHGEVVSIVARARSFLHRQVRNMTGTLRLIGDGRWTYSDLRYALAARDRRAGGPTAPACGLYLTEVRYML
ncbi:tRNA pseudouridine synthase A [invertebrate metagenome]|uniref:tRNA pseudouridine synthase A n=1 Tax=invertebrate metagenome TaxID=1711999 RepID=A0A484H590_9ZZZZ